MVKKAQRKGGKSRRAGKKAVATGSRGAGASSGKKSASRAALQASKPKRKGSTARPRVSKALPAEKIRRGGTKSRASKVRPVVSQGPVSEAQAAETKPESNLTPEEIEQFRQMLLQKRAEILGDVLTLHNEALNKDRREAAGDLSSMPIHMADLGTDNYELEFTLGLIEGERAILKEVDEALKRIQQGTYGICLATGKPIGKARLRAKPWAKYCYEYTLAQEQGQMRRF